MMRGIWRKLRIQWKLMALFTVTVLISFTAILLVVQNVVVNQLNARQREKISFTKNSVISALNNSRRMAVNYLTLISRDDAVKDSFFYAVRAREVASLESEFRTLLPHIDYDLIIARDSSGNSLMAIGELTGIEGRFIGPLECESEKALPGKVCDELWKWGETLLLGAVAPVYKPHLSVEYRQSLLENDYLGTVTIARALNDAFAAKVRETTGAEIVIRNGETLYATSLPELRKARFSFSPDGFSNAGSYTSKEIAGVSYLTASLPLTASNGETLGELIILADNVAIAGATQRIYFTIYLVSLVLLIIGVFLTFTFSQEIGNSIRTLSEGAEKIGRGDFSGSIEVKSHVELDYLARSFNSMSRNLKSLITEKENYLEEIRLQHEQIIEQKEYMASLFENANDLIYVADLDGSITFINRKIKEYGFGKEELIGKSMHSFITFRGRENGEGRHDGGDRTVYEVELYPRKGKARWMIFSSSPIRETGGAVTSELCILRDITDQRKLEDNITHVDRLACTGRLAAGLAHEIGNPLTSISSFLQLLDKKEHDPFTEDCIRTIQKHITRICFTVDRLKNLSRPHSFEKWNELDVGSVISSSLEIVRFDPRFVDVEIVVDEDEELPEITAQGDQLVQVLINLFLNSADAIQGRGTITVKTGFDKEHGEVIIEIADTGSGIPEDKLDQIFEPFFTTKGEDKGTGLGLYVCQSIIHHHGGRMLVKSEYGKGTNITLRLPLVGRPDDAVLEPRAR